MSTGMGSDHFYWDKSSPIFLEQSLLLGVRVLNSGNNPWRTAASLSAELEQFTIFRKFPTGRRIYDNWSGLTIQTILTIASDSCDATIQTGIVGNSSANANENSIVTRPQIVRHCFWVRPRQYCTCTWGQSQRRVKRGSEGESCEGEVDIRSRAAMWQMRL